jgi:hypothetical protein
LPGSPRSCSSSRRWRRLARLCIGDHASGAVGPGQSGNVLCIRAALLPGEPLITRFRRLDIGHVEPKFIRYTRQLTMLWTIVFAAGALASLAAAMSGNVELWSWIAFVLLPALTVALFLGEHVYRAYRYGAEERTSPLHTLSLMFHPQAWLPQPAAEPQGDNIRHG